MILAANGTVGFALFADLKPRKGVNVHHVTILGRVGSLPEVKTSKTGNKFTIMSVASSMKAKDKQITTWFKVLSFGKQADYIVDNVEKGDQVYIEGTVSANAYINKEGLAVGSISVMCNVFRLFKSQPSEKSLDNDHVQDSFEDLDI